MSSFDAIIDSLLFHLYSEAATLHCRTFHVHGTQSNIALRGITLTCMKHTQKVPQQNVWNSFQDINKHNKQTYYIKMGHKSNTKNYILSSSTQGTLFQCQWHNENND